MKKLISVLAIMGVMLTMLAGCGNASDVPEDYMDIVAGLSAGQGYAVVTLATAEHPVLMVAQETYEYEPKLNASIDATIYAYDSEGKVIEYITMQSEGTAYPISVTDDGYIMFGGNHHMAKSYIAEEYGSMMTKVDAGEVFDTDGNVTYYLFDLDNEFEGEVDNDTVLKQMYEDFGNATIVNFTIIK